MKSVDTYTLNLAAEQVVALDSMGFLDYGYDGYNYDGTSIENYLPEGIEFFCGASRMVFKLESLPGWVIKVDFKKEVGYCRREAEFYAEAKTFGIDYCFASTYKIMELDDGRVAILQEAVTPDEEAVSSEWYNYMSGGYCEEDECDKDYIWSAVEEMDTRERLYAIFGDDKRFNTIDNFCYDNNINDLHEGNWGFTAGGSLVIMDFAGYGVI